MITKQTFDVAVVGAGVFGAWTAYQLRSAGAEVVLLDAYGPGNSRSSSGGESRMIRIGYGPDEIYSRMALRSLTLWQDLFNRIGATRISPRLFQPTGILWLAQQNDPYCEATLETLRRCEIKYERLDRSELVRRYPQLELGEISWGILEPDSGVLMARQAVHAVVAQALLAGVVYLNEAILPDIPAGKAPRLDDQQNWQSAKTVSGEEILAKQFVFACGPWLPGLFPTLLSQLIHVTKQEVFFFGVPEGDASRRFGPERLPAWIDFNDLVYGIPNLDGRGFKLAIDAHGPPFDPDTSDRMVSNEGLAAARAYLAQRLPELRNAPVIETRVCQYENTANGDFLIDRHPAIENVWLVGGGSGHGFKHGPAVGEYVAALISGDVKIEPRFTLATKEKVQQRKVY
ncbi:MAG TPA: FAD-dependent oxidoreductase [Pyrinomonadaceae bacterium]|nr:FAD-dependent oxidoreductase [Pyrinomonadaceae bacterium]